MAETLPRLRSDLDFLPSPAPNRPGLMIRDPFRYSDTTLIIPPALVECLQFFDGRWTDLDLRAALVELTGDLRVGELEQHLRQALGEAGFFQDEVYQRLREERRSAFLDAPRREPSQAGAAYPEDAARLSALLEGYLSAAPAPAAPRPLVGIAAPHVSLDGGCRCYAAAYAALQPEDRDRVFVILGTSHYGEPERFGLTRKPFVTPLGEAPTESDLVERLASAAGPAVALEDYCHAVEHSIEFQVVFLQHRFGPGVRILPILCGAFARGLESGRQPEDDANVGRFLAALGELAAEQGERLCWVLGIDMAHMGRRYGDLFAARAGQDRMEEVSALDRGRIELLSRGDAGGFWEAVRDGADPLRWCGSAALYTFLRAVPRVRGELLRYEQWNIDEHSVVSFAAMAFSAPAPGQDAA
ncbi:MAG: AmmeMemoRadiSam system protein B [Bryobacteraceae bacterium]|jgi:AmmeMemoRadiSam system protein B